MTLPNSTTSGEEYDKEILLTCLFDLGKWWWGLATILKVIAFLVGAVGILFEYASTAAPFIVGALGIGAETCGFRSDSIRSLAQSLRRKRDFEDAFGWPVSNSEYADLIARSPTSVQNRACKRKADGNFFASSEPPGPKRAAANIIESAWWSKHLSERMFHVYGAVLIVTAVTAVALLVFAAVTISSFSARVAVARVVTGVLTLVLSVGVIRFTNAFYALSRKAARVEEAAEALIGRPDLTEIEVLKCFTEYHIARASAPDIPSWMWRRNRARLNALWDRYRAPKAESAS